MILHFGQRRLTDDVTFMIHSPSQAPAWPIPSASLLDHPAQVLLNGLDTLLAVHIDY